jgi:hypothetical protein
VIRDICERLRQKNYVVQCGQEYDDWDLEIRCGLLGTLRVQSASEDHERGRQLFRFRTRPRVYPLTYIGAILLAGTAIGSALDGSVAVTALSLLGLVGIAARLRTELRSAAGIVKGVCSGIGADPSGP